MSGQTAYLLLFCCCQHLFDITAKMELELSAILTALFADSVKIEKVYDVNFIHVLQLLDFI